MSLRSRNGRILVTGGAILLVALVVALLVSLGDDDGDGGGDGGSSGSPAADATFDADAKANVRSAQTALEVYAVDQNGDYSGATSETLREIEPNLSEDLVVVSALPDSYELTVVSETGSEFTVTRGSEGIVTHPCDPPGVGGCPSSGEW